MVKKTDILFVVVLVILSPGPWILSIIDVQRWL